MQLASKIIENDTLLIKHIQPNGSLLAPQVHLASVIAVQPSQDFLDASKTLLYASNLEGIEVIRQVFPLTSKDKKANLTGLLLLVKVTKNFIVHSDLSFQYELKEGFKDFLRLRTTTFSILEASGCKSTLITGKDLFETYYYGKRIPEGITVFTGKNGFHSKLIEPFLRLDRVPSRFIQNYAAPDLPVIHKIGKRIDTGFPVGFPRLSEGHLLVNGSINAETVRVVQQLINSLNNQNSFDKIFVIDTRNEFNGLIQVLRNQHSPHRLQTFRLGTNIHINLCDVVIPPTPDKKERVLEVQAAWKSHIISQIILNSLDTSDYLTSRYAVPLESQIRKTAIVDSSFTLKDVKIQVGGVEGSINPEGENSGPDLTADAMAVEGLIGILEHFKSFPEVNYSAFTGHFRNALTSKGTITFFQFGMQPPVIHRASIAFLLHFLSKTMSNSCIILTHADDILSRRSSYRRSRDLVTSSLTEACKEIAMKNLLVLGSQSLKALESSLDTFEEITNLVCLKMASSLDRELLMKNHQFSFNSNSSVSTQQQWLGILEGEGLLFRQDAPQNVAYHFLIESKIPVDFNWVKMSLAKQRGSQTLGLSPARYEVLMRVLKMLIHGPIPYLQALSLVERSAISELSLLELQHLGLFTITHETSTRQWIITQKGIDYYNKQLEFVANLPPPINDKLIPTLQEQLRRLEDFHNIDSPEIERLELNSKVKTLVGGFLNYVRFLKNTIPWTRIAAYYDLVAIEGLEWQDFETLFSTAYKLINDLLLDIKDLEYQRSEDEINSRLGSGNTTTNQSKNLRLDDYLPSPLFTRVKKLSQEIGLAYPDNSIFDISLKFKSRGRNLYDELGE
ncbi:MAG: hypothetical protein ACTSW1_15785 [Candidatus Hodarchaeales archaeon]